MELKQFDKKCFRLAIYKSIETFNNGNFPVGVVLVIDNKIIDSGGNEINKQKSYINHAENMIIIRNGQLLYQAHKQNKKVAIYSTFEPCLQCLGAAIVNHISSIYYIEKDSNGGACDLKHDNIGVWYKEVWPEIKPCPFTDQPKKLMIEYFNNEIAKGNTKWPQKMLELFSQKLSN